MIRVWRTIKESFIDWKDVMGIKGIIVVVLIGGIGGLIGHYVIEAVFK